MGATGKEMPMFLPSAQAQAKGFPLETLAGAEAASGLSNVPPERAGAGDGFPLGNSRRSRSRLGKIQCFLVCRLHGLPVVVCRPIMPPRLPGSGLEVSWSN